MEPDSKLKPVSEPRNYKRNLAHIEVPDSVHFITFSTVEGFVLSDAAKNIVFDAIKFHDGKKYGLFACVVMKNHAHCILQPLEESSGSFYSLAQIMHSIR